MAGGARFPDGCSVTAYMVILFPDGSVGLYHVAATDPAAYPSKRECAVVGTLEDCAAYLMIEGVAANG